jgi:hypothetical protein
MALRARALASPVRAAACAAALLPALASAEPRTFSLGVKGTYDAGTVFVTDVATGLGAGAALRLTFGGEDARFELAVDADIAGFTGEGDGDPILQLAASLARRGYFGDRGGARAYWFAGAGAGVLGLAGSRTAFPLRAGLGVSVGGEVGLDLAIFERFTVLHGSGDPAFDYINTVGVEVALRFGR